MNKFVVLTVFFWKTPWCVKWQRKSVLNFLVLFSSFFTRMYFMYVGLTCRHTDVLIVFFILNIRFFPVTITSAFFFFAMQTHRPDRTHRHT